MPTSGDRHEGEVKRIHAFCACRALAHWRSRCMGSAFYGWYALTLHRLDLKRSISLAVHHARRSRLTSCLHAWRARVGYKVGLALREQGYRALRAERLMENALLLLRCVLFGGLACLGAGFAICELDRLLDMP